jgi:hypothetical protein
MGSPIRLKIEYLKVLTYSRDKGKGKRVTFSLTGETDDIPGSDDKVLTKSINLRNHKPSKLSNGVLDIIPYQVELFDEPVKKGKVEKVRT